MMNEIEDTIMIGKNIRRSLDMLKSKVNLNTSLISSPHVQKEPNALKPGKFVESPPSNSKS